MDNKEKITAAWTKFQNKINELRKRQFEILVNFSKKSDKQKIGDIMDNLKKE
jgi:hypothetical protein